MKNAWENPACLSKVILPQFLTPQHRGENSSGISREKDIIYKPYEYFFHHASWIHTNENKNLTSALYKVWVPIEVKVKLKQ